MKELVRWGSGFWLTCREEDENVRILFLVELERFFEVLDCLLDVAVFWQQVDLARAIIKHRLLCKDQWGISIDDFDSLTDVICSLVVAFFFNVHLTEHAVTAHQLNCLTAFQLDFQSQTLLSLLYCFFVQVLIVIIFSNLLENFCHLHAFFWTRLLVKLHAFLQCLQCHSIVLQLYQKLAFLK